MSSVLLPDRSGVGFSGVGWGGVGGRGLTSSKSRDNKGVGFFKVIHSTAETDNNVQ
jgi:hypothetical protein